MSYVSIVASLEDVQSIPGADRVVSATARGYRLVVGSDHAFLVLQGHGKDRGEVDAEEAEALSLGEEEVPT